MKEAKKCKDPPYEKKIKRINTKKSVVNQQVKIFKIDKKISLKK